MSHSKDDQRTLSMHIFCHRQTSICTQLGPYQCKHINQYVYIMHLSNQGAANSDSPRNFLRSVNYITTRRVKLPSFDFNSSHDVFTNCQFI